MTRTYTTTLSLSIGGDCPTWEGEATVSYSVTWGRPAQTSGPPERCYPGDPDEVSDLTVTHIDGEPVSQRQYGAQEAATLEEGIWNREPLLDQLLQDAAEDDAGFELERWTERNAEWGMGQ